MVLTPAGHGVRLGLETPGVGCGGAETARCATITQKQHKVPAAEGSESRVCSGRGLGLEAAATFAPSRCGARSPGRARPCGIGGGVPGVVAVATCEAPGAGLSPEGFPPPRVNSRFLLWVSRPKGWLPQRLSPSPAGPWNPPSRFLPRGRSRAVICLRNATPSSLLNGPLRPPPSPFPKI